MSLRERIANWLIPESKAQDQGGGFVTGLVGLQTPNQPVYSDMSVAKATREGYKIAIPVYRGVRSIIQAGSVIPWVVKDKQGKKIDGHEFVQVLQRPNEAMSSQLLMELTLAHLCLPGNALWQPLIVGKSIKEIWPVMPDLVQPVPSDKPGEWLKEWQVTDTNGKQSTKPPGTFIHFMQTDPSNPYWGIGPLMAAARTVDTDNEAQDTQKISMSNRGLTDGVFKVPPLTKVQFEEARRQLSEQYLAKLRRRAPWIVSGDFTQMSMTPVEMDFIASRLQNKRDIAAAFGIDPWWVGDRETSTYNNVAEARRSLYEDAVLPLLDGLAATLNLRIAPLYGGDITIAYDTSGVAALREDYGKRTEQAGRLWAMGVPMSMCNEVLELGLQEYEGWDVSYLPMNMVPADMVGQQPEIDEEEETDDAEAEAQAEQGGEGAEPEDGGADTEKEPGEEEGQEEVAPKKPKSFNLETEEQKTLHWKKVDTRRQAYWNVVAKRLRPLYGAGGDAVVRAVRTAQGEDSAKHQAHAAIESLRPQWEKHLKAICMTLVEDFGNTTADDLGGKPKARPGEFEGKAAAAVAASGADDSHWVFDPFTPAAKRWLEKHVTKSVTLILRSEADRVSRIIERGFESNDTIDEIAKSLREFYDGPSARFNAMRTARTEVGAAAGYGQREAATQSGVAKTHQWIACRDDRVRDSHQEIDGQERPLSDEYSNGLLFPGDMSGDPAEFIMCFPPDTMIQASGVARAYRRWYEGNLVQIATAAGNELAGTPNHPVLTDRGWVPLGLLKKGDNVICGSLRQGMTSGHPHVDHMPAPIGQVFDAFAEVFALERVPGVRMDFHGDGRNGHVDVVTALRNLKDGLMASGGHPLSEQALAFADLRERALSCPGQPTKHRLVPCLAGVPGVGGSGEGIPFLGRGLGHSQEHGLGAAAWLDSGAQQQAPDDVAFDSEVFGDSLLGLAGLVERYGLLCDLGMASGEGDLHSLGLWPDLEPLPSEPGNKRAMRDAVPPGQAGDGLSRFVESARIVDVRVLPFSGHVFNLQTHTHTYIANNIIAHNCRCVEAYH